MKTLAEYEQLATVAHGHLCAGQILGLRMAIHGLQLLDIAEPEGKDRKRIVTFVEIDRCATDAITVVTGCRLGKRALKFRDFGKVAATFCDLSTSRAVRLVAKDSSKALACQRFPELADRNRQQIAAYRVMDAEELFGHRFVTVRLGPEDMPGYKGSPVVCDECHEAISFARQVVRDRRTLCRACAGERYYEELLP